MIWCLNETRYIGYEEKEKETEKFERNARNHSQLRSTPSWTRLTNLEIWNDRCVVLNPPRVGSLSIVDGQRTQARCGD